MNNNNETIQQKLINSHKTINFLKDYFKPFHEFMKEKNYTTDEAIKAKDSIHKFLTKYGVQLLENNINEIEKIINTFYK